jgi:hypothetical protein
MNADDVTVLKELKQMSDAPVYDMDKAHWVPISSSFQESNWPERDAEFSAPPCAEVLEHLEIYLSVPLLRNDVIHRHRSYLSFIRNAYIRSPSVCLRFVKSELNFLQSLSDDVKDTDVCTAFPLRPRPELLSLPAPWPLYCHLSMYLVSRGHLLYVLIITAART